MKFDLEDKKKISVLCDLLKAFMGGKSNVQFVWHRNEGWSVLQNSDYLDNLDSSNMVNICYIKPHFFSHVAPENRDFVCFELDITNYVRVLKSIKNQTKRMVWHIYDIDETQSKAKLQLNIVLEDGQMEVQKDIFLQFRVNPQIYFRIFREFKEDKTEYLNIKQSYMKQMKDLKKNECVSIKFCQDYVSAYNNEEENNICIKKEVLDKYNYDSLIENFNGRNKLTIPPNFLIPQLMMGSKIKEPTQLFIGNDILDDHVAVYLRTMNDLFTFISQFKSIIEKENLDYVYNPFDVQKQQQQQQQQQYNQGNIRQQDASFNGNMNRQQFNGRAQPNNNYVMEAEQDYSHLNKKGKQQQQQQQQQNQQYQSDSGYQNPLNSYGSVSSHIQGLTNQMHLIDNYPIMETENEQSYNNDKQKDEYTFKKPSFGANPNNNNNNNNNINKKKFNINQEYMNQQNNLNNSILQSNQIVSLVSSQQSNANFDDSFFNKRISGQNKQSTSNDAANRIKICNFAQSHQVPTNNNFSNININNNLALGQQQQVQNQQQQNNFNGFNPQVIQQQQLQYQNAGQQQQQQQQQLLLLIQQQQQQQQQLNSKTTNGFNNPLVSQDKQENSFSSFINQSKKEQNFSIFQTIKDNYNINSTTGVQFQPQKNSKNNNNPEIKSKAKFHTNLF